MKTKTEVWKFRPSADVKSLLKKAVTAARQKGITARRTGKGDGLRTLIIEEALRTYCAKFNGKREGNLA